MDNIERLELALSENDTKELISYIESNIIEDNEINGKTLYASGYDAVDRYVGNFAKQEPQIDLSDIYEDIAGAVQEFLEKFDQIA
jgi:hypothetical protein